MRKTKKCEDTTPDGCLLPVVGFFTCLWLGCTVTAWIVAVTLSQVPDKPTLIDVLAAQLEVVRHLQLW